LLDSQAVSEKVVTPIFQAPLRLDAVITKPFYPTRIGIAAWKSERVARKLNTIDKRSSK